MLLVCRKNERSEADDDDDDDDEEMIDAAAEAGGSEKDTADSAADSDDDDIEEKESVMYHFVPSYCKKLVVDNSGNESDETYYIICEGSSDLLQLEF